MMKKVLSLILFSCLFLSPFLCHGQKGNNHPFLQGIYTNMGRQFDGNGNAVKNPYGGGYVFYLKVYKDYLIETRTTWEDPIAKDYRYNFYGQLERGERVYKSGNLGYIISKTGDVIHIIESYDFRFGNNVKNTTYWQVLKGDFSQQLYEESVRAYQEQQWRDYMDIYSY